jgi:hypothetical protein
MKIHRRHEVRPLIRRSAFSRFAPVKDLLRWGKDSFVAATVVTDCSMMMSIVAFPPSADGLKIIPPSAGDRC